MKRRNFLKLVGIAPAASIAIKAAEAKPLPKATAANPATEGGLISSSGELNIKTDRCHLSAKEVENLIDAINESQYETQIRCRLTW